MNTAQSLSLWAIGLMAAVAGMAVLDSLAEFFPTLPYLGLGVIGIVLARKFVEFFLGGG